MKLQHLSDELDGKTIWECEIRKKVNRRSLDANGYGWKLIDLINERTRKSKLDIYRDVIEMVGVFDTVCILDKAKDTFIENWGKKGIGWIAIDLGASKIKGCSNVQVYYGTSTYDTKQMSRFIDELVFMANELGISTLKPHELEALKNDWRAK